MSDYPPPQNVLMEIDTRQNELLEQLDDLDKQITVTLAEFVKYRDHIIDEAA